jgi:hypothetical protein
MELLIHRVVFNRQMCILHIPNNIYTNKSTGYSSHLQVHIIDVYMDEHHICHCARLEMRNMSPKILVPDQIVGVDS